MIEDLISVVFNMIRVALDMDLHKDRSKKGRKMSMDLHCLAGSRRQLHRYHK